VKDGRGRRGWSRRAHRSFPCRRGAGSKQRLDELGPEKFAAWMRAQTAVLVTDTTMRDAHQSLLATACARATS